MSDYMEGYQQGLKHALQLAEAAGHSLTILAIQDLIKRTNTKKETNQ